MADFLVLGASGQQGYIVARFLLEKGHSVHGIDIYGLNKKLKKYGDWTFENYDVVESIQRFKKTIKQYNPKVTLNCMGMDTIPKIARVCLTYGIHTVDLGCSKWQTQRIFKWSDRFNAAGVTCITGCGSVPGIGNVMVKHAADQLDSVEDIEMGFVWDSYPKVFVSPFCITSVFEEYTASFEHLQDGKFVEKYPIQTVRQRTFNFVGEQKIFQSPHQENYTIPYHYMRRGLKNFKFFAGFPEHSDAAILFLLNLGFGVGHAQINGATISKPDALTLLLRRPFPKDYKEWENLWAVIGGKKNGQYTRISMECHVPPRDDWQEAGCNIDTGFPTAIVGQMLLDGRIDKRGVFSMEEDGLIPINKFFKALEDEKLRFYQNEERVL